MRSFMPSKLDIYEMRPEDHEEVRSLMKASGGGDGPVVRDGVLSLVARQEGKLVGALVCNMDGTCGYQYQDAQGEAELKRQVAMALIDKATRRLNGMGVRRCRIGVPSGAEGQPFWKAMEWGDRPDLEDKPIRSTGATDQMVGQFGPKGQ